MSRRVPFVCPKCKEPIATVISSEPWQGGIRRRRKCPCGYRVTTVERPVERKVEPAA